MAYQVWNDGGTITRNDSNKVYQRVKNVDVLMYDFNLVKGDSMVIEGHTFRVSEADTMIMKNGQHRKYVTLECSIWVADDYKKSFEFTWVEGIGDLVYGFNYVGLEFQTYWLYCYCDSSGLIYQRKDGITCDNIDSIGTDEPVIDEASISVFVEARRTLVVTSEVHVSCIELFDLSGMLLCKHHGNSVSLAGFAPGLYVARMQMAGGSTTTRKVLLK